MKATRRQQGFTLIELIVVIVILGILAATALPKFVDLREDAVKAKADGVAGAIAGGAAITYSAKLVGKSGVTYSAAAACTSGYLEGGYPSGCTGTGDVSCTVSCVDGTITKTATVTLPSL